MRELDSKDHKILYQLFLNQQWDFPVSGAIVPMFGPDPKNYEFRARKPQKGTCSNGTAHSGREKAALASALPPVD